MEGTALSPGREETPGRTIHININDSICCSFLCSKHCAFRIISFNLYSLLKKFIFTSTDKQSTDVITKSPAQGMQGVKQKSRGLNGGLSDTKVQALEPGISGDWRWGWNTVDPGLHSTAREALTRIWRGRGCSPRFGLVFETGTDPVSLVSALICLLLSEVHVLKLPMNYQTNSRWLLKSPIQ